MTIASVMESARPASEDGAPKPKDYVDADLVKLARTRTKIGAITSAGVVFLAVMFAWRLLPDRRFGSASDAPDTVSVADVVAGKVGRDSYIEVTAQPAVAGAIRVTTAKGTLGLRVAPVRATNERLWLVLSGDGGEVPVVGSKYRGRLRALSDLALAATARDYAETTPRAVFATAANARAAFANGTLATTNGDEVAVRDGDRVTIDVVDPGHARLVCTLTKELPDAAAWQRAIGEAGVVPNGAATTNKDGTIAFDIAAPDAVALITTRLADPRYAASRVDAVRRHSDTTWGELRARNIPAEVDLIGVYAARPIPDDAYALDVSERPGEYWYVNWVIGAVGLIAILFGWAFARAVRRDLLPTRTAA
jgi:hypothetical protein